MAAATTPAPLPVSESDDQTHKGSGIIPGDRPEFPLPTLDDKHHFLTTPESIDRPRTPPELSFEDSRALLTRLTGLQPWQLEAFPDELPPLPASRPSSPLKSPETVRPSSQLRERRLSSTAVPIRFRKPPVSPVAQRDLAPEPEPVSSPSSSPLRPRHNKGHSAEFKTSREFRPLYLLERNRKSEEIEEVLPALPSSGSPSRASSATETDAEYESALESPNLSASIVSDDPFFEPLDVVSDLISPQLGPELQHPELADREIEEVDESGQVTPKASDFQTAAESAGPPQDVLAAVLEDVKAKSTETTHHEGSVPQLASPLAPSAPLDDSKMRDVLPRRSRDASPSTASSRLQTAALGVAIGGATAAALRARSPSPSVYKSDDLVGGELDDKSIDDAAKFPPETAVETVQSTLVRAPSPSSPKGNEGKKAFKDKSIDLSAETSREISPADLEEIQEDPIREPKSVVEKLAEPEAIEAPAEPDPALLRRDSKSKGRKKAKGKKDAISESPLPTPTEMLDLKQFIPTFVDNEDDWAKNKSESIITDEATLVGEPIAGPSAVKELQREKILESTAPQAPAETEVRRAIFDEAKQSDDSPTGMLKESQDLKLLEKSTDLPVPAVPEAIIDDLEKTLADVRPEQELGRSVDEADPTVTPKGKKSKKNKKGKRGSQKLESEIASDSEKPTKGDEILPPSETQEEAIEREILKPSFIDAPADPATVEEAPTSFDDLVRQYGIAPRPETPQATTSREALEQIPTNIESGKPVDVMNFLVEDKDALAHEPEQPVQEGATAPKAIVDEPKATQPDTVISEPSPAVPEVVPTNAKETQRPKTPESETSKSGWGTSLWGALGWGKKKATSPTPTPEPKPATVAPKPKDKEDEKHEIQVPPQPVVPAEPRKVDPEPEVVVTPLDASSVVVKAETSDQPELPVQLDAVSKVEPPRHVPEVSDQIPAVTSPFVAPTISYFADDGKPSFTFPQLQREPAQEGARMPVELSKDGPMEEPKIAPTFVAPQFSYFADDGKPHFTFPTLSTGPTVDFKEGSAPIKEEVPIAEVKTTPTFVAPRSAYFADDGKPHFTFPTLSTGPTVNTTQGSSPVKEEVPLAEVKTTPTFVAPRSAYFADDGKPHFTYPTHSIERAVDTTLRSAPINDEVPIAEIKTTPTFVAPRSAYFTDDGKPHFTYPTHSIERAVEPTHVPTSAQDEVSTREVHTTPTFVAPQSAYFTDDGKPHFTFPGFTSLPPSQVKTSEITRDPLGSDTNERGDIIASAPAGSPILAEASPNEQKSSKTKKGKKDKKQKGGVAATETTLPEPAAPLEATPEVVVPFTPGIDVQQHSQDVVTDTPAVNEATTLLREAASVGDTRDDVVLHVAHDVTPTDLGVPSTEPATPTTTERERGTAQGILELKKDNIEVPAVSEDAAPVLATPIEEDLASSSSKKKGKKAKKAKRGGVQTSAHDEGEPTTPVVERSLELPATAATGTSQYDGANVSLPTQNLQEQDELVEPVTEIQDSLPAISQPAEDVILEKLATVEEPPLEPTPPVQAAEVEPSTVTRGLEEISVPAEHNKAGDDIVNPAGQVVEPESAATGSKKDKKKKKGKKAKGAETPIEEVIQPETSLSTRATAEDALKPEEISLPKVIEGELDVEPLFEATAAQSQFDNIVPESATRDTMEFQDGGLLPADSTHIEPQLDTASAIGEHTAVTVPDTVVEESAVATSSKKDKKKRKGKKGKTIEESEPSTPVAEVERQLEIPSDSQAAVDTVPHAQQQPVEDPSQASSLPDIETVREMQLSEVPTQIEPVDEVALPTLSEPVEEPSQPPTPMEEEVTTSSKKSKKKKGKKGKSLDFESTTSDVPDAPAEPEPVAEPIVTEPGVESVPAVSIEGVQEIATPIETSRDLVPEPAEELKSTEEAPILASDKPSHQIVDPSVQTAADPPVKEPEDIALPLEHPDELAPESTGYLPTVSTTEQALEVKELALDEGPMITSKKSKKKKGKKGNSVDTTEPSTPVVERAAFDLQESSEPVAMQKGVEDAAEALQGEVGVEALAPPVNAEPALESARDTTTAFIQDDAIVERAPESARSERAVEVMPSAAENELAQDTALSTAIEQSIKPEAVEPTSKKAKKKKNKKGKSVDTTEPSTPITEDPSMQFNASSEPTTIEKSVGDAPQPEKEDLATEESNLPSEVQLSSELTSTTKDEPSTSSPVDEPSQDVTEPSTPLEPAGEDVAPEPSSKKAKKKKAKKGKATQDIEPEAAHEPAELVPAVETESDVKEVEASAVLATPIPMDTTLESTVVENEPIATPQPEETPLENITTENEPLATPQPEETAVENITNENEPLVTPPTELPVDRELATEIGQLSEPIDFEMPLESPDVADNILPETPIPAPAEIPQIEEPTATEGATSNSKKAKKKKGKKGKSISEPETPVTEVDCFIPATSTSGDVKASPEPEEEPIKRDEAPASEVEPATRSMQGPVTAESLEATAPIAEPSLEADVPAVIPDIASETVDDQATAAPASKKDKKKGKKGKRVSVAEDALSAPATPVDELPRELESQDVAAAIPLPEDPLVSETVSSTTAPQTLLESERETQDSAAAVPLPEDQAISQPVSPKSFPIEPTQQELPATVLDDTITQEPPPLVEVQRSIDEQQESVLPVQDLPAEPEQLPEGAEATTSKKSKKKGKKAKRASVVESEPSTPLETSAQELERAPLDEQSVVIPEALPEPKDAAVSTAVDIQPATIPEVIEQSKDVDFEASLEEQPKDVTVEAQLDGPPKDVFFNEQLSAQPTIEAPILEEAQQPQSVPEDEIAPISKRDKKKAKKNKRVSIAEPSSVPATPIEEKEQSLEDKPLDVPQLPEVAHDEAVSSSVEVQPIGSLDFVEEPQEVIEEQPQHTPVTTDEVLPEQSTMDDAPALSKQDKKKAKKSKRASIAELESVPATPTEEKKELDLPLDESTVTMPVVIEKPVHEIAPVDEQPTEIALAPNEPPRESAEEASFVLPNVDETTSAPLPTKDASELPVQDELSAPLSKKNKKKAKKAKRGSVAESATSTPAETPAVELKESPFELQQPSETPIIKEAAFVETPAAVDEPAPAPVVEDTSKDNQEPEAVLASTKDKKKAKKAGKRGSVLESEPSESLTPPEQSMDVRPEDQQITTPPPTASEPAVVAPSGAQPVFTLTETAEPESTEPTPAEPIIEQPRDVITNDQLDAALSVVEDPAVTATTHQESVSTAESTKETSEAPAQEVVISAPISKQDKKKAKKSKRGSIAELEPSLPSTPADELANPIEFDGPEKPLLPSSIVEEPVIVAPVDQQPELASIPAPMAESVEVQAQDEQLPQVFSTGEAPLDREEAATEERTIEPAPSVLEMTKDAEDEPAEWATLSKSQKKKAKKAKRASIVEDEASQPVTPAEALPKELVPDAEAPSTAPVEAPVIEELPVDAPVLSQTVTEEANDGLPKAKKDKKKAKKGKRASIIEGEQSEPVTPVEEIAKELALVEEPSTTSVIEEGSSEEKFSKDQPIAAAIEEPVLEPTPVEEKDAALPTEEPVVEPMPVEEDSTVQLLSKKDKKKAKKAKRGSIVDEEISQPVTPAEEVARELVLDEQPSTLTPVVEVASEQPPADQSTIVTSIDEPTALPAVIEQPDDSATTSSKKKKKKAKKASVSEPSTVPFLAHETPEAANSDTQPSPAPSIPSETSSLLSGIPTSYPHVRDIEFVDNGGESASVDVAAGEAASDVELRKVVEAVDVEQPGELAHVAGPVVEADQPIALAESTESPMEAAQGETSKSGEKDIKGKKPASAAEEPIPGSPTTILVDDSAPFEPTARESADTVTAEIVTQPTDVLAEEPLAQLGSQVQAPEAQPIETSKAVIEEPATPTTPKKVKKHKLAALFEQKAAENVAPVSPRKRAPWAKPVAKTTPAELVVEAPKDNKPSEDIAIVAPEPVVAQEVAKPSEEIVEVQDVPSEIPAIEPPTTNDTKAENAIIQPQEAPIGLPVSEPHTAEIATDVISEPTDKALVVTAEIPITATTEASQRIEMAPEAESSLPTKKDKKKGKKSKKQSGTATPVEAMPEVLDQPQEERDLPKIEVLQPESASVVGPEAPIDNEEPLPELSQDGVAAAEMPSEPPTITREEQPLPSETITATPSEPLPIAEDDSASAPSKKETKKDKKAKKQSGTVTPGEEILLAVKQEQSGDVAPTQPEQVVAESFIEPEVVSELPKSVREVDDGSITINQPVEVQEEIALPTTIEASTEIPQQEEALPTTESSIESVQPAEEDLVPVPSKKDKKKSKKAKKQSGTATPTVQDATDIQRELIEDVIPTEPSSRVAAPLPELEQVPQESQPPIEEPSVLVPDSSLETGQQITDVPTATEPPVDLLQAQNVTEVVIKPPTPAEEDWGSTSSKKDKKKGKKGKKSGTATPSAEPKLETELKPEVVNQISVPDTQGTFDKQDETERAVGAAATDITEAEPLPIPTLPAVEVDEPSAVDASNDQALEAEALDTVDTQPLTEPLIEPGTPLEEEATAPLSKKDKKKAKKAKKASGVATPINEDVPEAQPEISDERRMTEPENKEINIDIDEAPAVEPQDGAIAEEQRGVEQMEQASASVAESEPVIDEWAVPATSTKKSKKKGKKSGTATPSVEDTQEPPIEAIREPEIPASNEKGVIVDDNSADPIQEEPVVEKGLEFREPGQETVPVGLPTLDSVPVAVTEPEPFLDDPVPTSSSKKKSKKKAKKSGTATPIVEDIAAEENTSAQKPDQSPEPETLDTLTNTIVAENELLPSQQEPVVESAHATQLDETIALPQEAISTAPQLEDISIPEVGLIQEAELQTMTDKAVPDTSTTTSDLAEEGSRDLQPVDAPISTVLPEPDEPLLESEAIVTPTLDATTKQEIEPVLVDEPLKPSFSEETQVHVPATQADVPGDFLEQPLPVLEDDLIAPLVDQSQEVAADADWGSFAPKKGKKGKKDKDKKQLATLGGVESKPLDVRDQARDDDKPPVEGAIERSVLQSDIQDGPSEIRDAEQPLPSTTGVASPPSSMSLQPEVRPASPTVITQDVAQEPQDQPTTSDEPERIVSTEVMDTAAPTEPEVEDITTTLSRKASKKAKKGKKVKGEVLESPALTEQPETSATHERTLEPPVVVEPLHTPTILEFAERESKSDPASTELPNYEANIERTLEPANNDTEPLLPMSEPTVEASIEPQAPEDVKVEADEDEWGSTSFSKKSKKDKKKGKKSKATSGITTPAEAQPEAMIISETMASDQPNPTPVVEQLREIHIEEPQVKETEQPVDAQVQSESPTPVLGSTERDIVPVLEPVQETGQKPVEVDEPDLTLSRTASKKDKKKKGKKGKKAVDDLDDQPSSPATPIIETPPTIVQEPSLPQIEVLPTITEAKVDAARSPSPPHFDNMQDIQVPRQESTPDTAVQLSEVSREITESAFELSVQSQDPLKEQLMVDAPSRDLSPDLKAVQDEVADFKLRSQALDEALASNEPLDESSRAEPTSFFDVVGKLSKKDKKKAKKSKTAGFDSEPTTTAAVPEAVVETKEMIENQVVVDERATVEVPSRKLSRKDKKKGKQSAFNWEAPIETPFEQEASSEEIQEPVVELPREVTDIVSEHVANEPTVQSEEPIVSVEEVASTPLDKPFVNVESAAPVVVTELEGQIVEEVPTSSRKLSKKDKKKTKEVTQMTDEPLLEPETTVPATSSETQDFAMPREPVQDTRAPILEASKVTAIVPELAETVTEEERPAMSRKLSKKDKKKAKQAALAWDEPVDSAVETTRPSTAEDRDVTQTTLSIPTAIDFQGPTPEVDSSKMIEDRTVPQETDVVAPEVEVEELVDAPVLTRKQSKKEKKKGKKSTVIEDVVEPTRLDDVEMRETAEARDLPIELPVPRTIDTPVVDDTPAVTGYGTESKTVDMHAPAVEHLQENIAATERADVLEVEADAEPRLDSKKTKKQKRKSKTAATFLDEPVEEPQPTMQREEYAEAAYASGPSTVEPAQIEAEDEWALSAKKGKKEKWGSNSSTAASVPLQDELVTTSEEVVRDESADLAQPINAAKSPDTLGTPDPPVLARKTSRKHKLAALFEQGATDQSSGAVQELRREGTGSVKNLAEQYESQSKSVTPVLNLKSEKPSNSRALSQERSGSKSPKKDFEFAGTLAAGLKLSGFGDDYVVNDPIYHQSTSPKGVRDMTPDDDVAAALDSASTSKFASRGWTTPTLSPKLRPTRETESSVLPPIEVAMASTDAVSFDPLDVLNDPTFLKRNTAPPGVLEEADPDELGSKLKMNKKAKGKKKPASLPESPVEPSASETVSFETADQYTDAPRSFEPGLIESRPHEETTNTSIDQSQKAFDIEQRPTVEEVQDDLWSATAPKKSKKSKKDKKRASTVQDSVENAAAETPAVETLTTEPPAVETPADSTIRAVELEETLPSASVDVAPTVEIATGTEATEEVWDEKPRGKGKRTKKEKSGMARTLEDADASTTSKVPFNIEEDRPRTATEPAEYPFPGMASTQDTMTREVTEETAILPSEKQEEDIWATPSKKSRKSRKGKGKLEQDGDVTRGNEAVPSADAATTLSRDDRQAEMVQDRTIDTVQDTSRDHKRRSHPVSFDEEQPYEKRAHRGETVLERTVMQEVAPTTTTLEPTQGHRGLSPSLEPTWSFAGAGDSAVHVVDSPVQPTAPQFEESTRDSGYHDAGDSPVVPQSQLQNVDTSSRDKKRRSREPKTPREQTARGVVDVEDSPALPVLPTSVGSVSSPAPNYATKERTSYLFDSSPSTRAYGTSPVVDPVTPAHDSRRSAQFPTMGATDSAKSAKQSHTEQLSPLKEIKQKEPIQSLFGDPSEKSSGQTASLATPVSKHGRTPSNKQLHTITETSPDDSPLHKKTRAITDVGAPDRGVKSARRTESPKPFSERLKSPPPVTPTPLSRKIGPSTLDTSGRDSPSRDSPWHQVHESVDRTMTLSPARRLPRSSPSFDPIKQHMAEQRSPSVASQRSMSNISKLRSPDQERPLSSASNRSTHSLRRVDRSASGDLRAVARLGEASAQDARSAQPNLSGIAIAAGATAAIAGIAAASKYDPVRGAGKGRRASMAESYVSI